MAEIIGLALAVPGVIDVIVRCAAGVYDKIDTFKHTDETTARFRDLASNIKEGTLFFALTNIKAASSNRLIPSGILAQLERALANVEDALGKAEQGLACVREDKLFGKLKYMLWHGEGGKSRLDKQFELLKSSCDELKDLCLQLHQNRTAGSCFLLTSDFFKLRHETSNGQRGCTLLPDSDIWIAQGNYVSHGQRIVCDFVLETKTQENDVRFLCEKLHKDSLGELRDSLLPVLGYRQPPYNRPDGVKIFQMVVELPAGLERSSLSHTLSTVSPPELQERLEICKNLALATQVVHSIQLVHKAIRPRSILMLSEPGAPLSTAKAYLQDWNYIREISGATTELGEVLWSKRIYQHPERQGEYADAVFETRHDIYSLGVCILEILLWKPFVVMEGGSQTERLRVCELFERYGFARKEGDGGLPERYWGDSIRMTSRPPITMTIWQDIASAELANADLVQLVLQCLQGDFNTVEDVVSHMERLMTA